MSKHTPGPWEFFLDAEFGLYRVEAKNELLAKAVGQNQETDEANARLIAAAPELLDALYGAKSALEANGPIFFGNVLDQIRAVIAKAEGQADDDVLNEVMDNDMKWGSGE